MSNTIKLIILLVTLVVIGSSFGTGYILGFNSPYHQVYDQVIIDQAWNEIFTEYINRDAIDTRTLSHAAIEGMIKALDDPYSAFLEPEEYEYYSSDIAGEYEGIGAYVTAKDEQIILSPIAGSPAEEAGVKAGDILLEIDGEPVDDMDIADVVLKVRGPEGTTVELLIAREGEIQPLAIEIIRDIIETPSVRLEMKDDFAHITITNFAEGTGAELADILQKVDEAKTRGIILDLRGNPGGLLDTVVTVASHFLADGKILDVRDNQGKVTTYDRVDVTPVTDLPMVVLVDSFSASASEVLTGALQDYGRATIAGTTTFGKGSVNQLIELNDGSAIYLTTSRWLTPDGHLIEGKGIEPDIKLELTGEEAVQWAIEYLGINSLNEGEGDG
jgi:carboxyl-terminal processing protease